MKFKNKKDLVERVKKQLNITLPNRKELFNTKRRVLYTEIRNRDRINVIPFLKKYGARTESHINEKYWIIF